MLIKFRPVKGIDTTEMQESHIHLSFYDDTLNHVSGHYAADELEELKQATYEVSNKLESYINANIEYQHSYDYADEATIAFRKALKNEARHSLYEAVKNCPFKILIDTSLFLILDEEKDIEDEWNLDLCQAVAKSEEFDAWASKASSDGYLSGHLM